MWSKMEARQNKIDGGVVLGGGGSEGKGEYTERGKAMAGLRRVGVRGSGSETENKDEVGSGERG